MDEHRTVSEYSRYRGRGSLVNVVRELERQVEAAADFVADTRDMELDLTLPDDSSTTPILSLRPRNENLKDFLPRGGLPILDQALVQVAGKLPIPAWSDNGKKREDGGMPVRFLRRALKYHPTRTLDFLNGVMHDEPRRRLVRCLDDHVRAFLSDSYRVIDSLAVAKMVLGTLKDVDGRVLEASLSDSHLRLKVIAPEVWDVVERTRTGEDPGRWYVGGLGSQEYLSKVAANHTGDLPMHGGRDTVWPIGTISNSETGHGGYTFSAGILQAICFNLATVEERIREVHLGSKLDTGIYKRDTVEAEAQAIFCRVRDNMQAFFTRDSFSKIVARVRATTAETIEKPSAACNLLIGAGVGLVEDDFDSLLNHFTAQPTRTVYDLGQAVARLAQDREDPGAADDLERLAGAMLVGKHTKQLVAVE